MIEYKTNKLTTLVVIAFGFAASTLITWLFIDNSYLYTSTNQKLLSCGIAGAKWTIQITAAIIILKEKKWMFLKKISLTCLAGSVVLLPYVLSNANIKSEKFFLASLITSVLIMIISYYRSVKKVGVHMNWYYGWLVCLGIAILLQLTIVF
jgi:hypothetical protein